jgi:hypothetical protein
VSGLLRGLAGSAAEVLPLRPAGARCVLLNAAVLQVPVSLAEAGLAATWRLGPHMLDHGHPAYAELTTSGTLKALRPLPPVHLGLRRDAGAMTFRWIRQTRIDGDSWDLAEVPLGESAELYRVTISVAGVVKRSTEVGTPAFTYGDGDRLADLGSATAFTIAVAQVSSSFGAGPSLERIIHV